MSFARGHHKDSLIGLDNDKPRPILRSPEDRKKKRYGISHHMCIHDWDNDDDNASSISQETNNHLVNGGEDSLIDITNDSSDLCTDGTDTTNGTSDLCTKEIEIANETSVLCRNETEITNGTSDPCTEGTDDLVDLTDAETDDVTISSDDNTSKSDDITSRTEKIFINGHRKLCATQSEYFMSETSDECDDTVERYLPSFHERYSKFFQSMADADTLRLQDVAHPVRPPRQVKPHGRRVPGPKPPIAPKPLVYRTQSDSKFIRPTPSNPLRPRSRTSELEPGDEENEHKAEDELNKNVIKGFSKEQPVIKHVRPPLPAPRKSIPALQNNDLLHTTPPTEAVSSNINSEDRNENGPEEGAIYSNEGAVYSNETSEEVDMDDKKPTQRRYGVIEPVNYNEPSSPTRNKPIPQPRSTCNSSRDSGSRFSANLEEIMCASPRYSANNMDNSVSRDSCGRYSLHLDNLQQADTSSDGEL